jgi:hypothetical protein
MRHLSIAVMLLFLTGCATAPAFVTGVLETGKSAVKGVFSTGEAVVQDVTVVGSHVVRGMEYSLVEVKEPVEDVVEVLTTPDKDQPKKHKKRK